MGELVCEEPVPLASAGLELSRAKEDIGAEREGMRIEVLSSSRSRAPDVNSHARKIMTEGPLKALSNRVG